jgi:FemAB-related protein (PEP-CTERM system-associated)
MATWDEFVNGTPESSFFHLSSWKKVMEDSFGLRCHYLSVMDGNELKGILPLVYVNSLLSGKYFTSLPGGICAKNEEVAQVLLEKAKQLVKSNKAKYLVLLDSEHKWEMPELVTTNDHVKFIFSLCDGPDEMWSRLGKRNRQKVRKAEKNNVDVMISQDHLEEFNRVYTLAMREKGTPVLGSSFFENMLKQFPENSRTIMVCKDCDMLGGWISAFFKDTIYIFWAGMLSEYYNLNTSHSIYWETMKYGCENGYQWLDIGRARINSGTYVYKSRWPAGETKPLYQQYFLNGIDQPPAVGGAREDNLTYQVFVKVWRRLPLRVTEILGPKLRKRMPFG